MEPSGNDASDKALDEALAQAAPRAPHGFADAVERRVGARRRHGRGWLFGAGALTAAAAALLLWLETRPEGPGGPPSGWTLAEARGLTVRDAAGATVARMKPGHRLPLDSELRVAEGGAAELWRPAAGARAEQSVRLGGGAALRVGGEGLALEAGEAELMGDGARLDGDAVTVTMFGNGAKATIDRRNEMTRGKTWTKWTGPTLMAVSVMAGGARVEARGAPTPVQLAQNDRALVAPGLPPLVTRAVMPLSKSAASATPAPSTHPTAKPVPAPAATPAAKPAGKAAVTPEQTPEMKDRIRTAIRATLGDLKECYESTLEKDAKVAGRLVVRLHVVDKDGKGRVADGEVVPEQSNLVAPLFEQCVMGVLGKAEFPRPDDADGMIVDYPFVFAPSEPSSR